MKNAWSNIYLIAHDAFSHISCNHMYTILKQQIRTYTFRQAQNCSIINAHDDLPVDVICKGKVEPTKCTPSRHRSKSDLVFKAPEESI